MNEDIYICTTESRIGLTRTIVEPYLVWEEGPTEHDPTYLLKITIPMQEWKHLSKILAG